MEQEAKKFVVVLSKDQLKTMVRQLDDHTKEYFGHKARPESCKCFVLEGDGKQGTRGELVHYFSNLNEVKQ